MRKFRERRKIAAALTLSMAMVFSTMPAMDAGTTVTTYAAVTTTSEVEKLESLFTTIDLMDATITELQEAMEKGEVTAKELVQMYIDRINAYDKSLDLNSIIMINPDALEQAEELDKERAEGNVKGVLHGIPIIVKDNYDVEGLPTSAGCLALKDSIAPDDAYVVKKLKEAGAIILAKANMSEFASSGTYSTSTLGGEVHNAYDTSRIPTGSSGGTAVAITSNFAAAGLGTDTGCSIRTPSCMADLFGIRVSLGLTSRDGVVPLNLDQDTAGPMCRSAEDLAIMLSVMAGTDENDSWTAETDNYIPEGGYTGYLNADGLKGKRIGYLQNSFEYLYDNNSELIENPRTVDETMTEMVETAKENLLAGGAELVDMSEILPDSLITSLRQGTSMENVFEWDLNNYFATLGENAPIKTVYQLINDYTKGVDYSNVSVKNPSPSLAEMTDPRSTESYANALNARLNFRNTINQILEENNIDAVVYVPYLKLPFLMTEVYSMSNPSLYTSYFGPIAGLPEMALPMGFAETNETYKKSLPMGMSMFTSYGNEEELVEIAYGYEQTAGYDYLREAPKDSPALEDENLNEYLDELMDKVDSIDYSEYTVYPQGKVNVMLNEYVQASNVDTSDVYATYEAAYDLAESYDAVMDKLADYKAEKPSATTTTNVTDTTTTSTAAGTTTVTLAKSKIKTITRTKSNKKIKITLKKQSKALGYQIKYSTTRKFKKGYTNDVMLTKRTTTLKGLNAKKKYYIKARAYAVSDGKIVYSKWSKSKTVKVKK